MADLLISRFRTTILSCEFTKYRILCVELIICPCLEDKRTWSSRGSRGQPVNEHILRKYYIEILNIFLPKVKYFTLFCRKLQRLNNLRCFIRDFKRNFINDFYKKFDIGILLGISNRNL